MTNSPSARMHLSGIFVYPVKSLRGCAVSIADIDELGIVGDRRFLVVDATNRFLTQRVLPRMALIQPTLQPSTLTLSAPEVGDVVVALRESKDAAPLRSITIWKSEGLLAEDCGETPAAWLSDFLGVPCRLVRIGPAFRRPMTKAVARGGDVVAFTDAHPFMAISEASLADLNRRLVARGESPLPMNRFRPNLVIADCAPYAEDTWPRLRIGEIIFRAGGPCARCTITTTNQETTERGKEPLRELAAYRRDAEDPTDVNFGQNFIHETKTGTLRIGDEVEPI